MFCKPQTQIIRCYYLRFPCDIIFLQEEILTLSKGGGIIIKKTKERTIPRVPYKVRNHYVTAHAVRRMSERRISKGQLYYNLTRKPLEITKVTLDSEGRPSYRRSSKNKITSVINPCNKNVISVYKLHTKKYSQLMQKQNRRRKR